MAARYQAELANRFGNLASRVTAMVGRYCDGVLPGPGRRAGTGRAGVSQTARRRRPRRPIDRIDLQGAIAAAMDLRREVNGYITEQEPWELAKDAGRRPPTSTACSTPTAEALRALAVLLNPVMPKASADALGLARRRGQRSGRLPTQRVRDAGRWGQLPAGAPVTKGEPLFPRIEDPDAS